MLFLLFALVASANACQLACQFSWIPVCGTDGRTYGNMCELTSKACVTKSDLSVAYDGECVTCNRICTMIYDPVCGSDGKTYGSACELTSLTCIVRSATKIAYKGECIAKAAEPTCQRICLANWEPVCGTDGATYGNTCELTSKACMTKSGVTAAYAGACVTCNRICTMIYDPVCGSDGKTYGSACELTSLSCMARSVVAIAHQGECIAKAVEPACNKICLMNWAPVCGTDSKTYGNLCELQSKACTMKTPLSAAYDGECLNCPQICTLIYDPVCGSDSRTYASLCDLEGQSCLARNNVKMVKKGEC